CGKIAPSTPRRHTSNNSKRPTAPSSTSCRLKESNQKPLEQKPQMSTAHALFVIRASLFRLSLAKSVVHVRLRDGEISASPERDSSAALGSWRRGYMG